MAALATAVFASCSNDEDLAQSSYPADNVVRVTTNVEDITTRAFHTTNTLDEFAFCIDNANNIKYSYNNIMMTKEGTNWNPSVQMLWQNSTQPVDIMAYAPFDSRGNTETMIKVKKYPVSVGTQQMAGTYESDFLVYKKTGFVPEKDLTNGAVDITFTHALSLLNIKIEFGTDFNNTTPLASNPINNINIGGSINQGYADLSSRSYHCGSRCNLCSCLDRHLYVGNSQQQPTMMPMQLQIIQLSLSLKLLPTDLE